MSDDTDRPHQKASSRWTTNRSCTNNLIGPLGGGSPAAFHDASWLKRPELVETLDDDRLRELGRRLIFLEEPAALDESRREQLTQWLRNRQFGQEDVAAGRTIVEAMDELDKRDAVAPDDAERIGTIRAWLTMGGA